MRSIYSRTFVTAISIWSLFRIYSCNTVAYCATNINATNYSIPFGTWVGADPSGVWYHRLDLMSDGNGFYGCNSIMWGMLVFTVADISKADEDILLKLIPKSIGNRMTNNSPIWARIKVKQLWRTIALELTWEPSSTLDSKENPFSVFKEVLMRRKSELNQLDRQLSEAFKESVKTATNK